MRTLIVGALSALLVLAAASVRADQIPVDPRPVLHAPSQPGGGGPPISHITSLPFAFTSPTGTSPGTSPCVIMGVDDKPCDFVNVTGGDWTDLFLWIFPGDPSTSCLFTMFFTNCVPIQQGSSSLPSIVEYFGGPGIKNTEAFGLSVVGWSADTTFRFSSNAPPRSTPEPATIVFTLSGGLILFAAGRWRRFLCRQN